MPEAFLHDVRYAIRQLRRSPGFFFVIVAIVALGVGANTALFSLLNAIVLRTLPVKHPDRLVAISLKDSRGQQSRFISYATYNDVATHQQAFEAVTAYSGGGVMRAEVDRIVADAVLEAVAPNYFDLLGERPIAGRFFDARDGAAPGEAAPVVVIGYNLWRRRFGARSDAVGSTLRVEGLPLTVIGVMRREFHGLRVDGGIDVVVLLPIVRRFENGNPRQPPRAQNLIARLRAGVTRQQAQAELEALWPSLPGDATESVLTPRERDDLLHTQVRVESIAGGFSSLRDRYAQVLRLLNGATSLLLLIACVNLSALLLARALNRGQEMTIRVALGATRRRLVQLMLVESLLPTVAGSVVALPLAWWTSRTLLALLGSGASVPLAVSAAPDTRVLLLTAAISFAAALIVGALPGWIATRVDAAVAPRQGRGVTTAQVGWAKILLIAQIALSLVLLFGAGVVTQTLADLRTVDGGFRADGLVFGRAFAQLGGYRNLDEPSYYASLIEQLRSIPGVDSAALSHAFPAFFNFPLPAQAVARADATDAGAGVDAQVDTVSPRFFETVAASLVDGRDFTWHDDKSSAPVAVIGTTLSHLLFPSGDAVGRFVRVGGEARLRSVEIVGVVSDVTIGNIRAPHRPVVFRPALQESARTPIILLRTSGASPFVMETMRRTVSSLGREYVRAAYTVDEQIDQALLQERLTALLSSCFAALAFLLVVIGLWGLLAYAVTRRTGEIGMRMAMGATRSTVMRMIVREGLTLAVLGIALGAPAALAAARLTRSSLFGAAPSHPGMLAAAAAALVIAGVAAGLWPARRASSVDPLAALRHE